MGRSAKPDEMRAKTITFRGSESEKTAIALIAEKRGMDVADFTREAIMAAHGDKITALAALLEESVP